MHGAACSVAAVGAPHLWDRRGTAWDAHCGTCRKVLRDADGSMPATRRAAALALGALVAAPWSAAPSTSGSQPGAADAAAAAKKGKGGPEAVAQGLWEGAIRQQLLVPLGRAAAADDRCSPCWRCSHLPRPAAISLQPYRS